MGSAKTTIPTVTTARVSTAASTYRRREVWPPRRVSKVMTVTMLAKNRVRQTSQNGSPRKVETAAAAGNEEMNGAATTAPAMKTPTRCKVSKREGASLN